MTVTRVQIGGDDVVSSQSMPTSKGRASSEDHQGNGYEVRRGGLGHKHNIADASGLQDNDLIQIEGMEIPVHVARNMGLLQAQPSDPSLSVGAAVPNQAQEAEPKASETGNAMFDEAANSLAASVNDGHMTYQEATAYEGLNAELAMTGLSYEHAMETILGMETGEVDPMKVPGDVKSMLSNAEGQVKTAATESAKAELGEEGFNDLQHLAATLPQVNSVVRRFAADRAAGKSDGLTWSDLHASIRGDLGL